MHTKSLLAPLRCAIFSWISTFRNILPIGKWNGTNATTICLLWNAFVTRLAKVWFVRFNAWHEQCARSWWFQNPSRLSMDVGECLRICLSPWEAMIHTAIGLHISSKYPVPTLSVFLMYCYIMSQVITLYIRAFFAIPPRWLSWVESSRARIPKYMAKTL